MLDGVPFAALTDPPRPTEGTSLAAARSAVTGVRLITRFPHAVAVVALVVTTRCPRSRTEPRPSSPVQRRFNICLPVTCARASARLWLHVCARSQERRRETDG
jgi:hypothetical protein